MKIQGYKEDMCEKEQVWKCMKKGESMKKYENVWRIRTRCYRRWMDRARQEKREGGYFVPI